MRHGGADAAARVLFPRTTPKQGPSSVAPRFSWHWVGDELEFTAAPQTSSRGRGRSAAALFSDVGAAFYDALQGLALCGLLTDEIKDLNSKNMQLRRILQESLCGVALARNGRRALLEHEQDVALELAERYLQMCEEGWFSD